MKKPVSLCVALAALLAAGTAIAAEAPPVKVVTIAVTDVYKRYWRTIDNDRQMRGEREKMQGEVEDMRKAGQGLVDQFEERREQATNTVLSEEARKRASDDANRMLEQIRQKEEELQQHVANYNQVIGQKQKIFQDLMLDEISRVALDIGKARGATMILDRSGPTGIGISAILYSDPAYDITEEVVAHLNRTQPTGFKADNAPAPAAPAAPMTPPPAGSGR